MKKNYFLSVLMALLTLMPVNLSAFNANADFELDGIDYKIVSSSDLTCAVYSASGIKGGTVNIPAKVTYRGKEYKVIGIGNNAFRDKYIKELNIAEGITYIGSGAFYRNSIKKIVIPSSVTNIGVNAFKDANKANSAYQYGDDTELIIRDSGSELVGEIEIGEWNEYTTVGGTVIWNGENPYYRQPFHYVKLKKVYIGRNIGQYIVGDALCEFTEEIVIGDMVTSLPTSYLTWERNDPVNLSKLKKLTIGKGLTSVPKFMETSNLKEIYVRATTPQLSQGFNSSTYTSATLYVPRGRKSTYQNASVWGNFLKIEEYDVQDNSQGGEETSTGTSILNYKYEYTDYGSYEATVIKPEGAKYAGSITIPQTVEKNGIQYYVWCIGDEAFANCKDLKSVEFPRNFISIGNKAFYNCTGLTSIEINASTVYKSAFEGCSNLNSVVFQGTDQICARAFAGCSNLTSITIPEDLRMMGDDLGSDYNFGDNPGYVFDGCDNLSTVIINTEGFSTSERSILYSGPVFANLPNLKDFYCSSHKMPSIIWVSDGIYYSDFFKNTNIKNATLHVLPSLLEEFKKTAPWSGFGNIVGDMTDINGVKANPIFTDGTVYDLMGRKLKEPRKGINIINGKKVFVK